MLKWHLSRRSSLVFRVDKRPPQMLLLGNRAARLSAGPLAVATVLALAFHTMIGTALMTEAFGVHVPRGYVYAVMAFSLSVEFLNMRSRAKRSIKPAEKG